MKPIILIRSTASKFGQPPFEVAARIIPKPHGQHIRGRPRHLDGRDEVLPTHGRHQESRLGFEDRQIEVRHGAGGEVQATVVEAVTRKSRYNKRATT